MLPGEGLQICAQLRTQSHPDAAASVALSDRPRPVGG
jgi:hypothetical protein